MKPTKFPMRCTTINAKKHLLILTHTDTLPHTRHISALCITTHNTIDTFLHNVVFFHFMRSFFIFCASILATFVEPVSSLHSHRLYYYFYYHFLFPLPFFVVRFDCRNAFSSGGIKSRLTRALACVCACVFGMFVHRRKRKGIKLTYALNSLVSHYYFLMHTRHILHEFCCFFFDTFAYIDIAAMIIIIGQWNVYWRKFFSLPSSTIEIECSGVFLFSSGFMTSWWDRK